MRHLFYSKQFITIRNRIGHYEGYYLSLEFETAMANAIDEISSYLATQVVTGEGNALFHCEWDNLKRV